MKIIFMGTPDFAVPALEALATSDKHTVSLVVTQPDRQKGRSDKLVKSPVKVCAEAHNIPVFQPLKVKAEEAVARLREEQADICVVAAYGQILSQEILDMPKYGCVNIHGSLLPKYRGAAPIQWAVVDGEEKSGLTIMQMDAGLDTGDMMLQEEVVLDPKETAESLYDKLSALGGPLILKALDEIEAGTITKTPQDDAKSTYAKILKKEMGEIHWEEPAVVIERLVRGMNSWPSAYTAYNGKSLKIWDADVAEAAGAKAAGMAADIAGAGKSAGKVAETSADNAEAGKSAGAKAAPGTILEVTKDHIVVACGDGALVLNEVQLEGKKRMRVHDLLLGNKIAAGEKLG